MTTILTAQFKQAGPGAPVQVSATESAPALGDNLAATYVLAVRATNVLPNPLSAAAHFSGGQEFPFHDTFWQQFTQNEAELSSGGVLVQDANSVNLLAYQPVDTNFAVGRYVWVIATDDEPAAGTSVPVRHAGPYLIR